MSQVISLPSDHQGERNGAPILAYVVHTTVGTDSRTWLVHNSKGVSCHVLIAKDGTRYRMVPDAKAAHHCGGSRIVLGGRSYTGSTRPSTNQITLGVELENLNTGSDPYPEPQLVALGLQIAEWRTAHGALARFRHEAIDLHDKTDPAGLDWATIDRYVPGQQLTRVIGARPSVSLAQFRAWLRAHHAPLGEHFDIITGRVYDFASWLDIDPAFVGAVWAHETSQQPGRIGSSDLYKKSNNAGATKAYGRWPSVSHNGAAFNTYESPQTGLFWLVGHLKEFYGHQGLYDVETIIPAYAPASDRNKPASYIAAVLRDMAAMRQVRA